MPIKTTFFLKNDVLQVVKLLAEFDGISRTAMLDKALREYTKAEWKSFSLFKNRQGRERILELIRQKKRIAVEMDTEADLPTIRLNAGNSLF